MLMALVMTTGAVNALSMRISNVKRGGEKK